MMIPSKSLFAIVLVVFSLSINAHSNVCEYSVGYDININQQQIKFEDMSEKKRPLLIFSNDQLLIDGVPVALTDEQIKTSRKFQTETRNMLPKVAEIVVEGGEIGVKAATLAVNALFGNDKEVHKDLIRPIEAISEKIKANVSRHSFNSSVLEESFDQDFEQQIETLVSTVMTKYSGKIMSQVLSSIFSEDSEEVKDFEFRMENLEYDIETYVEENVKELERKAENLCESVSVIAELDKRLESVKGYPENGVIQEGSQEGMKISGVNINFD